MLLSEPKSKTSFSIYFIEKNLLNYELFGTLSEGQILKKYRILGDVEMNFSMDVNNILKYPYAAPRATMLSFIKKNKAFLMLNGITKKKIGNFIKLIELKNGDSEIIRDICVPATRDSI